MAKALVSVLVCVKPEELDRFGREGCRKTLSPLVHRQIATAYLNSEEVPALLFVNGPQVSCVSINSIMFGHKAVIPGWSNDTSDKIISSTNPPSCFEQRSSYRFSDDCFLDRTLGTKNGDLPQERWAEIAYEMVKSVESEAQARQLKVVVYTLPPELFREAAKIIATGLLLPQTSSPISIVSISNSNISPVFPPHIMIEEGDSNPSAIVYDLHSLDRTVHPFSALHVA